MACRFDSDNDNRPIAVASNEAVKNGTRFLSVCSGIEAASVAWPQWDAVAFSEIEKFPSAVLAHHYPDVPNLGDFTKIDTTKLGRVDVLAGGTPCQAFSVAGLRGGLEDARGNLTLKFVELAHALAAGNGLRNVVWENVVGVLSDKGNAFGCFLAGLVGADAPLVSSLKRGRWPDAGMVAGPEGRAAWRILDAQYFGLAQRRRRVIVVADFGNGADPAAVLLVEEGVRRDSPPGREAREGVTHPIAPSLVSSGRGVERPGDTRGQDPVVAVHAPQIARCVATREGSSQDYETTTMVAVSVTGQIAHTLKAEGADASEDGTGRGTPIVAFGGQMSVPQCDVELSQTLQAKNPQAAFAGSAVRRLTPVECERLMGFPDDWTNIPWRGKPTSPDGPRYKSLGNSWAVPLFAWLGRRIDMHMPPVAALAHNDNKDRHIDAA